MYVCLFTFTQSTHEHGPTVRVGGGNKSRAKNKHQNDHRECLFRVSADGQLTGKNFGGRQQKSIIQCQSYTKLFYYAILNDNIKINLLLIFTQWNLATKETL